MRDERAGGLGIMDDVSWSNFFLKSLTLGLLAGSALGMVTGGRSLLIGAEAERILGRSSVRDLAAVRLGREGWLGVREDDELPREVEAVVAINASCARLVDEVGSTPL